MKNIGLNYLLNFIITIFLLSFLVSCTKSLDINKEAGTPGSLSAIQCYKIIMSVIEEEPISIDEAIEEEDYIYCDVQTDERTSEDGINGYEMYKYEWEAKYDDESPANDETSFTESCKNSMNNSCVAIKIEPGHLGITINITFTDGDKIYNDTTHFAISSPEPEPPPGPDLEAVIDLLFDEEDYNDSYDDPDSDVNHIQLYKFQELCFNGSNSTTTDDVPLTYNWEIKVDGRDMTNEEGVNINGSQMCYTPFVGATQDESKPNIISLVVSNGSIPSKEAKIEIDVQSLRPVGKIRFPGEETGGGHTSIYLASDYYFNDTFRAQNDNFEYFIFSESYKRNTNWFYSDSFSPYDDLSIVQWEWRDSGDCGLIRS